MQSDTYESLELRQIVYRDGVLTFSIPDHWDDEYEKDGSGVFYADEKDSGTLRLNITTTEPATMPKVAADLLSQLTPESGVKLENLDGQRAMRSYMKAGEEKGKRMVVWYWEIANIVPPKHTRMAVFTYTVPAYRKNERDVLEEVDMLGAQFRRAKFSADIGK